MAASIGVKSILQFLFKKGTCHTTHCSFAYRFLVVPFDIPRRCTATYFPEANVLVPIGSKADISRTPTSKSILIKITPA